jgi:uncharacterized damage-inducible protein DinB
METNHETAQATQLVITAEQLLAHWQGHRKLTRRVIAAFPETELFHFSIGGMRTFADLVKEMLSIAAPGAKGMATDQWEQLDENMDLGNSKEALLQAWDKATDEIDYWWHKIKPERFQERVVAFGQYEDIAFCSLLYFIDNEIHHRGQAYVYLRALGIEPPFFYQR